MAIPVKFHCTQFWRMSTFLLWSWS